MALCRSISTGGTPGNTERVSLMAPIANEGSLVFNSRSDIFQGGAISGTGSVTQNGSGALVLGAKNTYSGGTTINNGVLLASEVIPGNVAVNLAGALGGSAIPGEYAGVPAVAGDLSNAGTVVVSAGDSRIGGNYSQASTGTLAISLGSKLDVAGTVTLDGGTLEVTGADSDYVANTHTNVMTAAGGITGIFDQLVKGPGVVFTATTINYDANNVWLDTTGLDVTVAGAGAGVGYTGASMSSAQRVQGCFDQLDERDRAGELSGCVQRLSALGRPVPAAPTLEQAAS